MHFQFWNQTKANNLSDAKSAISLTELHTLILMLNMLGHYLTYTRIQKAVSACLMQ